MSKNLIPIFLITVFVCDLFSGVNDIGVGARASGLSNAFTAISDDASGIYYNPGGLGFITKSQCNVEYSKLLNNLSDGSELSESFAGFVFPYQKFGTFGFALTSLGLNSVVKYDTFYISYSKLIKKSSFGISFKYLSETYNIVDVFLKNDPVFMARTNISNFSIDAGYLTNIFYKFFLGINFKNINQPQMRLLQTDKVSSDIDKIPFETDFGIAFRDKTLKFSLDMFLIKNNYKIFTGIEKWFFKNNLFGIRFGCGVGVNDFFQSSFGNSINFGNVQIDYGFVIPIRGILTSGSHRLSFIYRFQQLNLLEFEPDSFEYSYKLLELENKKLKTKMNELKIEKDKLQKEYLNVLNIRMKEKITGKKTTTVTEEKPIEVKQSVEPVEKSTGIISTIETEISTQPVKQPKKIEFELPTKLNQKTESIKIEQPQEKVIEEPKKEILHIVKENETLKSIAIKYYNDPNKWIEIYKMNKSKIPQGRIYPGLVLSIP